MRSLTNRWMSLGIASGPGAALARLFIYVFLAFLAIECITIDFAWPEQAALGILTIALTFFIHGRSKSELVTLILMYASVIATARYCYWRCSTVFAAAFDPSMHVAKIDLAFMLILLSAEIYAFLILFLGYIQTARPLRRPPAPMPDDIEDWPDVDVLIPTYNEPYWWCGRRPSPP